MLLLLRPKATSLVGVIARPDQRRKPVLHALPGVWGELKQLEGTNSTVKGAPFLAQWDLGSISSENFRKFSPKTVILVHFSLLLYSFSFTVMAGSHNATTQ